MRLWAAGLTERQSRLSSEVTVKAGGKKMTVMAPTVSESTDFRISKQEIQRLLLVPDLGDDP